jgi:hypothetical protein
MRASREIQHHRTQSLQPALLSQVQNDEHEHDIGAALKPRALTFCLSKLASPILAINTFFVRSSRWTPTLVQL